MRNRPKKHWLAGWGVLVFCALSGAFFGMSGLRQVTHIPPTVEAADLTFASDAIDRMLAKQPSFLQQGTLVFTDPIETLSPAFAPESIVRSEPALPADHTFRFAEKVKAIIEYELRQEGNANPHTIAAACLNADEIENYAGHLQRALALPVSAEPVITFKLMTSIPEDLERTLISFADPSEIASRLPWQNGGNPLTIARVHFVIGESECGETDYALPPTEIREAFRNLKAVGYEIGVWK